MTISPEDFEVSINPDAAFEDTDAGFLEAITTPQVRGEAASKLYAGQAAMINGAPDNGEMIRLDALQPDAKDGRKQAVQNYYGRQQQDLAAWLEGGLASDPNNVEATLLTAQEVQSSIINDSTGQTSDELAYVKSASPSGNDELQRRKAFQMAAMNEIADMTDNQGWLEDFADFGASFIPFGYAVDVEDIDSVISERPELAQVAGANLEEVVTNWHSLDVERQQQLFPHLKEAIVEATKTGLFGVETDGNLLKAQQLLIDILDPEGASGIRGEQAVDVAFGAVDVIPFGALTKLGKLTASQANSSKQILKGAVDKLRSDTSAAKVALDSGDINSAAIHTVTAMTDEDVAKSMNKTKVSAALDSMPIQTSEWFKEVIDDDLLPNEVALKLNEAVQKAAGYKRSITSEQDFMQLGVLNGSERHQVITNWNQEMVKRGEDYLNEGMDMSNLKIVNEDKTGFTYQYTLRHKDDPLVLQPELHTGKVTFKMNDVTGTYSATVQSPTAQNPLNNIVSPSFFAKTGKTGDFHLEVQRAIQSSDIADGINTRAAEMLNWAAEPLKGTFKGKARGRLEDVLLAGDEFINEGTSITGKTFSPTELAAGIETPKGTVRLTAPDEVEAYYRMRMFADNAFNVENQVMRRELELGGFKEVRMFSTAQDSDVLKSVRMAATSVGKVFDTIDAARASLRGKDGFGVWDDVAGEVVTWSDEYIDEVYESGDRLVRLRKDWNTKGTGELDISGEQVSYVRIKPQRINDLPEQVLHYKPGYVPKDNIANFAVKQLVPVSKRGVTNATRSQAVRLFNSLADAKRFQNEKVAQFAAKNNVTIEEAGNVYQIANVDELTAAERLEDAVGSHGGLYHGERSKDDLVFGLSGQQVERRSPFEAFQRQIGHIGTFVSRNEVRVASEKRWLNTVKREFPEVKIQGFDGTVLPSNKEARALERMRIQIKEWNGIPTREETMYEASMQRLHDWMLGALRNSPFGMRNKESVNSLNYLKREVNPVKMAKSAVMHMYLGVFNPVQLFTQASALTVALSRTAFTGVTRKTAANVLHFSYMDNVRGNNWKQASNLLFDKEDMDSNITDAYAAWRRSGLYESVFNNADTAHLSSSGLGVSWRDGINKAANASLLLYRAGELTNRRFSFMAAFNTWSKRTGKNSPSDDELSQIIAEANKSMLQLNAANRAYWQGGGGNLGFRDIAGMATQFMQVTGKTMENIIKKEGSGGFTKNEKQRIIAGQAMLYGSAGVPLGTMFAPAIADWLGMDEMHENTAQFINQGAVGVITNSMLGLDAQVSSRFALGGSVSDLMKDILTNEDTLMTKMLGASGQLGIRVFQSLEELRILGMSSFAGDKDLSTDELVLALSTLASIPSSTRNLMKGYIMHNSNVILDRRGRPVVSRDYTAMQEFGTALGFQPLAEARARVLQWSNRETQELINDTVEARVALMHRAVFVNKLDPMQTANIANAIQIMDEALPDYVSMKVREAIIERIYGDAPMTLEERELKEFIERTAADKMTEDAIIDSNLSLKGKDIPIYRPFAEILNSPGGNE